MGERMSSVEELLYEDPSVTSVITIDGETRSVTVPDGEEFFGVEGDKDVERKYFRCPKVVGDNIDLLEHQLYVSYVYVASEDVESFPDDADGLYHCEDVKVDGEDITFSWLLSGNVFKNPGFIAFKVMAKQSDEEGNLKTKWNTLPAYGTVLMTVPDSENMEETYPDVINQIIDKLDKLEESSGTGGGITEEIDPTVPEWAKNPTKPTYTASEVGADASGTAETKVSEHNVSGSAHNDIRLLIQGLTTRLNTLADSDDETLDQMSEIVTYIKSNKTLIDAITTQKVSVADIVDNLVTNVSNKPLSAAQGVALKALIDGITIPETLPNPQKLKFTGAVTAEYDGSTEQTVNIPESTGGDSYTLPIMSDTQLGGGKAVAKTDEDVPVAVDPETGQLFVPTYPESASADIPRQEMQNTDTTVTLEPNKLYVFPEMASLTVTLGTPSDINVENEYHFFFTSGQTATTLTLNDVLSDAYSIEANMKYEVSILENVAYVKGVDTGAA